MTTRSLIAGLCIALALLSPQVMAEPAHGGLADLGVPDVESHWTIEQDLTTAQRGGPSLNEAVEQVRRRYPGARIVRAQTKRNGNREEHQIRFVMPDGRVRNVTIAGRRL